MFRAIFAHLQERKTEIFTAYGIVVLVGRGSESGNATSFIPYT